MKRTSRRPLRVKVRTQPRVPVAAIAAVLFAFVALALLALTDKGGSAPGRLANTGSDLSPWAIAGVAVLVLGGIAFLVVGQLRKRSRAN